MPVKPKHREPPSWATVAVPRKRQAARRSSLPDMRQRRRSTVLPTAPHELLQPPAEFSRAESPDSSFGSNQAPTLDDCPVELGESWADFVLRSTVRLGEEGVSQDPASLFETFRKADDIGLIYASFTYLFDIATRADKLGHRRGSGCDWVDGQQAPPWARSEEAVGRRWHFPYEPIRLVLGGSWKAKKLWKLLDDRCARSEYSESPCANGRFEGRAVTVVGAGPCGLRAAIELRLLGARVTVLERRTSFTRINQLHIWSWVGEEMKLLGARVLEPPPLDFGANPDILHVGISDLQKLLLKVSLLLGVEVLFGVDYLGTTWFDDRWQTRIGPAFSAGGAATEGRAGETAPATPRVEGRPPPSPQAPSLVDDVAAVFGANGFGGSVGGPAGIESIETEGANAIGLIVNLARRNDAEESQMRSFAIARQFYAHLFAAAAKETGADLENMVYVKSHTSHYMVLTPTAKSLAAAGALRDISFRPLVAKENVDLGTLHALVRRVAAFQWKKDQPALLASAQAEASWADSGPRLFDFSRTCRAGEGLAFQRPPDGQGDPAGENDLLVSLCGDCLMEPFWPEGLGIVRGWFSVLDTCAATALWAGGLSSQAEVWHSYDDAYTQLKTLSASTRSRVLRDNEQAYRLAPSTRYRLAGARRPGSPVASPRRGATPKYR